MGKIRFFVALEIPEENKPQFLAIQEQLKSLIPNEHLTEEDQLHLTLAFIGEQDSALQDGLVQILQKAAFDVPKFTVTPGLIDGFPNIHHPEVLWVGVKGDIDKVLLIRERIKDGLGNLQLAVDERRFIPHITVGKIKNGFLVNQELEAKLQELMEKNEFAPINITSIKLFASVPEGGFHKHNTLAEIKLV